MLASLNHGASFFAPTQKTTNLLQLIVFGLVISEEPQAESVANIKTASKIEIMRFTLFIVNHLVSVHSVNCTVLLGYFRKVHFL